MTAMLLIIDDDPAMSAALRDNLEAEGYRVRVAATCGEGREDALSAQPDLILLDVMLPDCDGMLLCRELRDAGVLVPIIMLTARGEERDRVLGLDLGTDDYIVKPFSLRELLARIRAHLRRARGAPARGEVSVGAALLDLRGQQVRRDGRPLPASARELKLLQYLVTHRGEVVSREVLLREVWGHRAAIATRSVDNFIVRLRRKIEPDPANPRWLLTIHGSGYKLLEQ